MSEYKGAILIITHSRADTFDDLMNSIDKLREKDGLTIVLVHQLGFDDVAKSIQKWRDSIQILIQIKSNNTNIAQNIARNRLAGYSICFDSLGVDWVLALEDDVVIAPDSIQFTKFIIEKYIKKPYFRGINLGSRLIKSENSKYTYTKTRYGIYGQGSVLTNKSWAKMQNLKIIKFSRENHWDSAMEYFMKTGMTIAPNNSRYIDQGWSGTHTASYNEDGYFKDVENSFVGFDLNLEPKYTYENSDYFWRSDLKRFNYLSNFYHWVRFFRRHPYAPILLKRFRLSLGKVD
jgi:ribosomal protein S6